MIKSRLALASLVVVAGLGVSACATDGYYGGGYGGYYGDYYDYNGGYWDDGGAYYGPSYYGWYGDYYYPGTGVYVYDRNHNRHRWNDRQRAHGAEDQQSQFERVEPGLRVDGDRGIRLLIGGAGLRQRRPEIVVADEVGIVEIDLSDE